jgi:hypothetical protein
MEQQWVISECRCNTLSSIHPPPQSGVTVVTNGLIINDSRQEHVISHLLAPIHPGGTPAHIDDKEVINAGSLRCEQLVGDVTIGRPDHALGHHRRSFAPGLCDDPIDSRLPHRHSSLAT